MNYHRQPLGHFSTSDSLQGAPVYPGFSGRGGWLGWLGGLAGLLLFAAALSGSQILDRSDSSKRTAPNILLIVADDLGVYDVGFNGNPAARTPTLDELAANGVRFSRHYADSSCAPSRASILTGVEAPRLGFRPTGEKIPDDYPTLAELLGAAGYETRAVGKWHLGESLVSAWPLQQGFERWFGFLNQWQLGKAVAANHGEMLAPTYQQPFLRTDNEDAKPYTGHLTDVLTSKTVEWIEELQESARPWLLYHAFFAPHTPIQPVQRFSKQFAADAEGQYRALVAQMDAAVQEFIDALRRTDQLDNTMIVFLSDNGGTNKAADNNFPFYGKKNETYEGSLRTPLIISWPQKFPVAQEVSASVMNTDIFPTLAEVAGVPIAHNIDGQSLVPHLTGHTPAGTTVRSRLWEVYQQNIDSIQSSQLLGPSNQRLSAEFGLLARGVDLNIDPGGRQAQSHITQAYLSEQFWPAHRNLKKIFSTRAERGDISIQQQSIQRTPGLGGVSIGLGLTLASSATEMEAEQVLATQCGVWSLVLQQDGRVRWDIAGQSLLSEKLEEGRCNSVVLSSHTPSLFVRQQQASRLKLFVNEELQSSKSHRFTEITAAQIAAPTRFLYHTEYAFHGIEIQNMSSSSAHEMHTQGVKDEKLKLAITEQRRQRQLLYPEIHRSRWQLCD